MNMHTQCNGLGDQSDKEGLRCGIFRTLGLGLGASTISLVRLEAEHCEMTPVSRNMRLKPQVVDYALYPHEGNPKQTLLKALENLDLGSFDRVAATGRRFREFVNLSSIPEPEAVEYAYRFVKPRHIACPAVVSAGGETFMAYVLNRAGRISNVLTGNKCASGTGEFFLQQLRRMNVSLAEAAQFAASETPHDVSGRCSVFCKSDCTHAINKGVPKARVTAGLCKMMAAKILELLKKVDRRHIMLTGGSALNQTMVAYLRQEIPGLIVPAEAPYFEALGAALWALDHETRPIEDTSQLFDTDCTSFNVLAPLREFESMVEFKSMQRGRTRPGDICILGLDVGSTTTKATLLREADNALLASVYLRTDGDPVSASRKCYESILKQIEAAADPESISIIGLGVTGSGRQIAALHALSEGVVNEIIAHAAAAVQFDPGVDTIFEIGGQDAKYTYITNGVPSDYAMNEACSAGTGSFLEESALETLGVRLEDIAPIALKGASPPNFNDQCAAFIASDIKNAIHEGLQHQDIVAGLVFSICMNYSNRVKGNRPVGAKVFMQGGVCYNRAVPLAMAALTGKPVIVPPEPGLMGAYGVALVVKQKLALGLLGKKRFDLGQLANRAVVYGTPFRCGGGKEKCDRRCEIAMIELEGRKYPFGGACNRYYNLRRNISYNVAKLDMVRVRQYLVFEKYGAKPSAERTGPLKGRIGFNRSFLVNTYYPLYATFFSELGLEPVLPDSPSQRGIDQRNAPFCFPAELAHGLFYSLLEGDPPPDYIFLPHFKAVPSQSGYDSSQLCPFVQGETFYLKSAFREKMAQLQQRGVKVFSPLLDLTRGMEAAGKPLTDVAQQMGVSRTQAETAFKKALKQQQNCLAEMRVMGKQALSALEADPEKSAVVLFARPYNGFVEEAHMGIPHKLASRGVPVLPLDFLPLDDAPAKRHMYWGMGQLIMKAGQFVKNHPQLFGTYITNFSCGPDSFIIGYFRDLMGRKPSLTLELDSHTADAGLETRIEAFLDIVTAYRQLETHKAPAPIKRPYAQAQTVMDNGVPKVITSSGELLAMNDDRVTLLFPSMGDLSTRSLAAVFKGQGFNTVVHPPADETVLKLGRANTSCKECLPLILTTGTLLNYISRKKRQDEILIYFMATGSGPCRFGQYAIFMEDLIQRLELPDVALFSLSSENSYAGLQNDFHRRGWWAVIVSDVMEDIRSMLLANAAHTSAAQKSFTTEMNMILEQLETGDYSQIEKQLNRTAATLARIPLKRPPKLVPTIALVGEIFVRRDALSRQQITERLACKGFATVCAPVAEWLHYCDYLMENGLADQRLSTIGRLKLLFKKKSMFRYEKRIKTTLSRSGLVHAEPIDVRSLIRHATPYISPQLTGEAILTIASSLAEVVSHACGVIAIGPFGCMPNRLSEAILNETMNRGAKLATDPHNAQLQAVLADVDDLPFLAIESDGSPFPQIINAKLEAFCLRALRLHARMRSAHDAEVASRGKAAKPKT